MGWLSYRGAGGGADKGTGASQEAHERSNALHAFLDLKIGKGPCVLCVCFVRVGGWVKEKFVRWVIRMNAGKQREKTPAFFVYEMPTATPAHFSLHTLCLCVV